MEELGVVEVPPKRLPAAPPREKLIEGFASSFGFSSVVTVAGGFTTEVIVVVPNSKGLSDLGSIGLLRFKVPPKENPVG